jgi:hypothetical protein
MKPLRSVSKSGRWECLAVRSLRGDERTFADSLLDKDSNRRSMFKLSNGTPGEQEAGPSSSSNHQTSPTAAIEKSTELSSAPVDQVEVIEAPSVAPPQVIPSRASIPSPGNHQPSAAVFQFPGSDPGSSVPLLGSETPKLVTPQQTFAPPRSVESANDTAIASRPVAEPLPFVTPSPSLGFSRTVSPHQATVSPIAPQPPYLVAPTIPPIVLEPPSLVTPSLVLGTPQTVIPQAIAFPTVPEPPLVTPEISQPVRPHQAAISHKVNEPHPVAVPSATLGPSTSTDPLEFTDQRRPSDPPNVTRELQTIAPHSPSDLAKGHNPGVVVAAGDGCATRPRRDSIEGAPGIMLTLGGSGYEFVPSSWQLDIPTAPPSTASSSSTPSPDELIIPSSQQSLEGSLTIPMDIETNPLSSPTTESEITTPASGSFRFAPRVIPAYRIDRSDFPSWILERGRLDYVLNVEAGTVWEKLIGTWLRQERRLEFGINEKIVRKLLCPRPLELILTTLGRGQVYP